MSTANKVGVILMTYGSATTADGVPDFLSHITGGNASAELISEFENRYRLIGRSPLVDITTAQAQALENKLGENFVVRAGYRHSAPYISDAVADCLREGATSLIGIILSPQFSSVIMSGYEKDFNEAVRKHGIENAKIAGPWPTETAFIELLSERVHACGTDTPIVFTTHSLPKSVLEKDPGYLAQLEATIAALRATLPSDMVWYAAYQSAGHYPAEWMKPDLTDILKKLNEDDRDSVLIVPIQFLADHLEILYDLDIAAKKQCEDADIRYQRIQLPNTAPLFIESLTEVALRAIG